LYSFLFHRILGWKITGQFNPQIKKSVVIVAPHTHWHDFIIGALTRAIINVNINFVAKKELFKWPFGLYFRWMGGTSIDRSKSKNTVAQVVEVFKTKTEFRLAIAPEGTRKKVKHWKTGFYYMALEAEVPIISVAFDYQQREVKISEAFYVSGKIEEDLPEIRAFYQDVKGKLY